jgi:hypothetical protein
LLRLLYTDTLADISKTFIYARVEYSQSLGVDDVAVKLADQLSWEAQGEVGIDALQVVLPVPARVDAVEASSVGKLGEKLAIFDLDEVKPVAQVALFEEFTDQGDGHDLSVASLLVVHLGQLADAFAFESDEVVIGEDEDNGEEVGKGRLSRSRFHTPMGGAMAEIAVTT